MRNFQRYIRLALWLSLPVLVLVFFNNCGDAGVLDGDETSASITDDPVEQVPDPTPTNIQPSVQPIANMNLEHGHRVLYQVQAQDDAAQTLKYSASGLPLGLSINEQTGMISGMVRVTGNFPVSVQVSDGELTTVDSFNVNIIPNQGLVSMTAKKALVPPVIDGDLSEYAGSQQLVLTSPRGGVASYSIMYDNQFIYFAGQVWDDDLNVQSLVGNAMIWRDDSIELLLDGLNNGGAIRDDNDYKFFVNVANNKLVNRANGAAFNLAIGSALDLFKTGSLNNPAAVDAGYGIELRVPWAGLPGVPVPQAGTVMGFDISFNDRLADGTNTQTFWKNANAGGANDPDGWGDLVFQ